MRKMDEIRLNASCLAKARWEEMLFVLLARDPAAPAAVRFWIAERIRLGLDQPGSPKLADAEECARIMEEEGGSK